MNLNRRIEQLETTNSQRSKVHIITAEENETTDEAMARFCKENGLSLEELESQEPMDPRQLTMIFVRYD